jgi:tetratricopeptide (TPR) repeat protein
VRLAVAAARRISYAREHGYMARDYADVLNGKFGDEDEAAAPVAALSFIFGSGVRLLDDSELQEARRIAVYPCVTATDTSELAQGLMCALAWILNSLDGVTAIPLITKAPSVAWTSEDSAFTPDSYTLEGLGEDTLLTATLKRDAAGFTMTVTGITDIEDIDDFSIELQTPSEDELLGSVLDAAIRLSVWLGSDASDANGVGQAKTNISNAHEWLTAAFAWHRDTLADAVSEKAFDLASPALQRLISASNQLTLNNLLSKGIVLAMIWFEAVDTVALTSTLKTLPYWHQNAGAIARALIKLGKTREALALLESAVEKAPEFPLNWLVLARLYTAFQQPAMAIEALQVAIERHQDYAPLLMQYGDALMSYADQNIPLEEILFIDEGLEPAAAFEGIAAYEEAVRLLCGEQQSMAYVQLIAALARYYPDRIWQAFEALAASDSSGLYMELALNAVAAQEDIDRAIESLRKATQSNPDSGRAWRNLAYAQYLAGEADGASTAIEEALKRAVDVRSRGEYELMALYAQDTTIEAEFAEIADSLSAEGEVTDRTLEVLEWIVTEAPHYIEGYLLLGRAYDANGESGTALEVLLDAEKRLGADADIYVAIIDLLLEAGEETVALDYVTKALDAFPRHIPLLARAALVADVLGDRQGAKAFLRKAHNIVPYHREILRVTGIFRDSEDD